MNEIHIPTVGNQANVLSIATPLEAVFSGLLGRLTQVGVLDPTLTIEYNTLGFTPVFSRTNVGEYISLAVPNLTKTFVFVGSANRDGDISSLVTGGINIGDGRIALNSYNFPNAPTNDLYAFTDGVMTDCPIEIKVVKYAVPTTVEELFSYMTKQMDATQTKIWRKMVLRFNGIITEVDGDTYRRTLVFADSTQIINS